VPDKAEMDERKGVATGKVPKPYLDASLRVQVQRPFEIDEARWRQTIDDRGRFVDQWGSLASEFGWMPGDLPDVPGDGKTGWRLALQHLTALNRLRLSASM
jgi:hypothetical protein